MNLGGMDVDVPAFPITKHKPQQFRFDMVKKRGRTSVASMKLVATRKLGDRPQAPINMNIRAKEEWLRVVNSLPSDWFKAETQSILCAYCEHVAEGDALQIMIEKVRPKVMDNEEDYKRYRDLQRDKELQTRAMLSCATKMRMTQQSSYTTKASSTAKNNIIEGKKPWSR